LGSHSRQREQNLVGYRGPTFCTATSRYAFIHCRIFYFRWDRSQIEFHTMQINTMLPRLLLCEANMKWFP